jgi:hypothetical protein
MRSNPIIAIAAHSTIHFNGHPPDLAHNEFVEVDVSRIGTPGHQFVWETAAAPPAG